jgi:cobalt/nickel transport system permease protein
MHISEGILSAPVLLTGAAVATAGLSVGLKKMDYERIPQVAFLSAAFFVASLVHVPLGPANAHLVLNGLLGLILGWVAFPAILVGLILQAALFQFGGFTTLGVNTAIMALPAVMVFLAFGRCARSDRPTAAAVCAFLAGAFSVFLGSLLAALALVYTGDSFVAVAKLIVAAHLPLMIVEGIITALCVRFLKRVKPEIFEALHD